MFVLGMILLIPSATENCVIISNVAEGNTLPGLTFGLDKINFSVTCYLAV
jgi:hypothetical protein